jgi:hypothetical protein
MPAFAHGVCNNEDKGVNEQVVLLLSYPIYAIDASKGGKIRNRFPVV